jgi:hypothetical protein
MRTDIRRAFAELAAETSIAWKSQSVLRKNEVTVR